MINAHLQALYIASQQQGKWGHYIWSDETSGDVSVDISLECLARWACNINGLSLGIDIEKPGLVECTPPTLWERTNQKGPFGFLDYFTTIWLGVNDCLSIAQGEISKVRWGQVIPVQHAACSRDCLQQARSAPWGPECWHQVYCMHSGRFDRTNDLLRWWGKYI